MIKNLTALILLAVGIAGCSQNNSMVTTNSNVAQTANNTSVVSSHGTETGATPVTNPGGANSSASSGGSPMAKAIDVSQLTAAIDKADKAYKAKPADEKAKKNLAAAYFARAFALTDAAQYRSALGDFRRGLKLDPTDGDAKGMHDQIISIFQSIGREPPKEGEEPAPLPFGDSGQTTSNSGDERINFAAGATTATASGNLKNYDDAKKFLIKVNAGQNLKTEQIKDEKSTHYITVAVKAPNGEYVGDSDASCNNRKEISPTVAGDYTLEITECKKADQWNGNFKLSVSVR